LLYWSAEQNVEKTVDSPSLPPADLYINRELSMLEFNKRVLALAQDPEVPLLERLRFLCITCTNLDEFFEIRVAALKQRMELGALAQGPESLPAQQVFDVLRHHMISVVSQQYELLNNVMFPQLAKSGVRFVRSEDWSEDQQQWLSDYFDDQVVPVLTPLTFDPSRPFPRVLNKSLKRTEQESQLYRQAQGPRRLWTPAPPGYGTGTPVVAAHHPASRTPQQPGLP
jgi:polyphosphate kinase